MKLESIYSLIKKKIQATEKLIAESVKSDVPIVKEMGKYVTTSGGKRIRPALLCLVASAAGYQGEDDVKFGVVFEFVHTATLIHDDIIDNADTRRGKQVIHRKFGSTQSILFGDWLFNTAMGMAVERDDFRIVRLINTAVHKMIEGEIVQADHNFSMISEGDYFDLIERKTAYVFAAAAKSAAIIADAGPEVEEALFEYGRNIGMAFQVIDDYFDYTAKAKKLGKPVGSDLLEGKITYPLFCALKLDNGELAKKVKAGFKKKHFSDEELAYVTQKIIDADGLEATRQRAVDYTEAAIAKLECLEESTYLDALRALPKFIVERDK